MKIKTYFKIEMYVQQSIYNHPIFGIIRDSGFLYFYFGRKVVMFRLKGME